MADYRPALPFTTALILLTPTYETVKGTPVKKYPETSDTVIYASFKTYGGTERVINDLYSIEDTANVETWYRPDIKADCRIRIAGTDAVYDIISEPENINMRGQFLKFKVRRVKGGA